MLVEVFGGIHPRHGIEYSYKNDRFRPIVERKTDISFAHEILKKASKKQGADA